MVLNYTDTVLQTPTGEEMIPDRIQFLIRSPERIAILEALENGPARQCTLKRTCSIARSTVHRNLEGCERRGLVTETDEGYALTPAGEHILAAYHEFADIVGVVDDHQEVLERLWALEESPPVAALRDCETTVATAGDPHAPSVAAGDVIRRNAGDSIRIAVSALSPITNRAGQDALAAGSRLESVVDPGVLETLRSSYRAQMETAVENDRIDVLVSSLPIDTGLVLAGEEVGVVVHDRNGSTMACLTGSNPDLRDWAENAYGRLRETATAAGPDLVARGAEQ